MELNNKFVPRLKTYRLIKFQAYDHIKLLSTSHVVRIIGVTIRNSDFGHWTESSESPRPQRPIFRRLLPSLARSSSHNESSPI
jgi:hypothetical protein